MTIVSKRIAAALAGAALLASLGSASYAADVGAGVSVGGAGGINGGAGVSTGRGVTGGAGLSIGGSSGVNGGAGASTAGGDWHECAGPASRSADRMASTVAPVRLSTGGANGTNGGAGVSIGGADGVNVDVGLGTASINPRRRHDRQRRHGRRRHGRWRHSCRDEWRSCRDHRPQQLGDKPHGCGAVGQGTRPLQAPLRRSAGQLEQL